jgi:hypothetical protein
VVAEHADLWNIPGGDIDDAVRHSPTTSTASPRTRSAKRLTPASSTSSSDLSAPYPADVARWVTDELITTSA